MPTVHETILHDPTVSEVRRRLRDAYGPRLTGIYLFGSRARGEAGPDSDWDFAVVLADFNGLWHELQTLSAIASDLLMERDEAVMLIPMTLADFASDRRFPSSVRRKAIRLGHLTVARP